MRMKPIAAAIALAAASAASAQMQIVQCQPAHPWEWAPSWGSMSIWNENTLANPNGVYYGAHYFFWHEDQRVAYFQKSRGTTRTESRSAIHPDAVPGRIVFGMPPLPDATFELKTTFKNSLPGFFYSKLPSGPISTTLPWPYLKSGESNAERWAAVGTWMPYEIKPKVVYWTLMPMVGSSDYMFVPARSPVTVGAAIGKKYPADAVLHERVRPCGDMTIVPEEAAWVAPFECRKYSYEYHLSPLLPEGMLGATDPNPRNIVTKRMPGADRFRGGKPRRIEEPSRDFFIPDLIRRPGQNSTGASFGVC